MEAFNLEGKKAVITGASRGIGLAIAKKLARQGAHCILVSRKIEGLNTAVEKIQGAGGSAQAMACHTGHPDAIEEMFASIAQEHGQLDILVNNAAANPHFGEMLAADAKVWDKVLDVNLKGPFFMIQAAVPLMKKRVPLSMSLPSMP